jgi:hypothetical protein
MRQEVTKPRPCARRFTKSLASIVLACWGAVWSSTVAAQDSCALERPPREAAVTANHGRYLFIFPRKLPPSYSGCQVMWDEGGGRLRTSFFENGELRKVIAYDPPGAEAETCIYERRSLVQNASSLTCRPFEERKDGLLPGLIDRPSDDMPIPPERDIRAKEFTMTGQELQATAVALERFRKEEKTGRDLDDHTITVNQLPDVFEVTFVPNSFPSLEKLQVGEIRPPGSAVTYHIERKAYRVVRRIVR